MKFRSISALDITLFFRQLATLIAAGVPIVQCCEILSRTQKNQQLGSLINHLKNEIEAGKTFAASLQKFPHYFDEMNCHLIYAGEQTGKLEIMLKRIAYYKEKSHTLRNQVKQALIYPIAIFIVAILVCLILLIFVVPRFEELFRSMNSALPAFTQGVIILSNGIRAYYGLSIIPLIGLIVFIYYLNRSMTLRQWVDHFILQIPFINTTIQKVVIARFSRSLATTFSAGLPITEALKIVAKACGNYDYTKRILGVEAHVAAGQQLHVAMLHSPLFPILAVQMIKIGEEAGSLEHMLEKIADLYESDIDYLVRNLSHLLEPLIMLILGVLIGGLVIAMYLPIFKLGTIM